MDFLAGLNPQQQQAVSHVEGPLLILAGAGSGKTRVITHRIGHLISTLGVHPSRILAVTFTNKAAGEMRERVANMLHAGAQGAPGISTFHSFCVRLLRRDGEGLAAIRQGFTRQFAILDEGDQQALVKSIYRHLGYDEKALPHKQAISAISRAKNSRLSVEEMLQDTRNPASQRVAHVYKIYEERLRQANALDFDDLLLEAVRLLRHDAGVRERWARLIQYLMIDEYQDTNRCQYELMLLLSAIHRNVCVVGDEDQSIYSWRGADIRNILDFERDFKDAAVIRLEQNYRSTKTILAGAGAVVSNNLERKGKNLWTESGAGDPIAVYAAPDGQNEALYIADTIDALLRRDPKEQVAVLYRTNFQSRQIEEALRRYGRPYTVVGGLSFYQRAEIKDILAYLKFILNPHDSVSLTRIINTPARGIGKSTVEQVEQYAARQGVAFWDAMGEMLSRHELGTRAAAALESFRRLAGELFEQAALVAEGQSDVGRLLKEIVERSGYRKMLEAGLDGTEESRLGNLDELLNAAGDAAQRGETPTAFLDQAALVSDADSVDMAARISLLTVHNAKGLEFPVVFIAGLEEGLFPHSRSMDSEKMMEEERRLCYVGMTRARKRLYMTWAGMRRRYGGGPWEPSLPSRFLSEVPPPLVKETGGAPAPDEVDLFLEQHVVREAVQRTQWPQKTYNSLENITDFFRDRGLKPPAAPEQGTPASVTPERAKAAPPAPERTKPALERGKVALERSKTAPERSKIASVVPIDMARRAAAAPHVSAPPAAPASQPRKKKRFGAGSTVEHPRYGRGTVVRREGEGDDAKLTVLFPGHGLKKLVEKFAGLKREE